jgi:hypothetical protein
MAEAVGPQYVRYVAEVVVNALGLENRGAEEQMPAVGR